MAEMRGEITALKKPSSLPAMLSQTQDKVQPGMPEYLPSS